PPGKLPGQASSRPHGVFRFDTSGQLQRASRGRPPPLQVPKPSDRLAHAGMATPQGSVDGSHSLVIMTPMSAQASVHSIDGLKVFRVALALYSEDTLAALGAIEAEVRRTVRWLEQERPVYWQEQIKRRREQVSMAKAEVFRRQLQKRPDYTPPMSEQKENLRR